MLTNGGRSTASDRGEFETAVGIVKAWVSDDTIDAYSTFTRRTGNYVETDGTIIAYNWVT